MLTLTDRCDRCGAQAFYAAFIGASVLLFCAHHGRVYMPKLAEIADDIYDGTCQINPKPSVSASVD